jgi:hypothetical protein
MVERHSTSDSSEELMNWLSPAAQEALQTSLEKKSVLKELAPA